VKTDGQGRDKEGEQDRVKTDGQGRLKVDEQGRGGNGVGKGGGSWSRKEWGFRASCSHGKDE
jgi:hypothetical protein